MTCSSGCGSAKRSRIVSRDAASRSARLASSISSHRREVPLPVGEVTLRRDPVVVERAVVVLKDGDTNLRTVAGTDDRLVEIGRASCRERV